MTAINLSAVARVLGYDTLLLDKAVVYRKWIGSKKVPLLLDTVDAFLRTDLYYMSDGDLLLNLLDTLRERVQDVVLEGINDEYECSCWDNGAKKSLGTGPTWLEAVMRCAEKL